jgi:flagellar L-ring protein precursor FlgH
MQRLIRLLQCGAGTATLLLAGCSFMSPHVEVREHPEPVPPQADPEPSQNGSIFQTASYRPLFEDHRARLIGDTLTVQIVEKVSATQTSASTIAKTSGITGGVTALPGVGPNAVIGRLGVGANLANSLDGKGSTANTNDFSGTLTVTVRQVLPNGHLIVAGEKQIGVNANVDVMRFSGQVDPRAIQTGNVVQSTQIANVRLEHRGRGAQADAQEVGWLQRVFFSVFSPL